MFVVNLYGGPGTGKSTTAAGVFSGLKMRGCNVELVTEVAKDLVWGERMFDLSNQILVFGEQYHRLFRLKGKVECIITDSPLFLSVVYGENETDTFKALVQEKYNEFENVDIFLEREKEYNPIGRTQKTEEEAVEVDKKVIDGLQQFIYPNPLVRMPGNYETTLHLTDMIYQRLSKSTEGCTCNGCGNPST